MQTLKGQYQTLKADALVDWQPTQGFEVVGNRVKPPQCNTIYHALLYNALPLVVKNILFTVVTRIHMGEHYNGDEVK
jgi:hypothetical protein